jgi:hypothetical protein
MTKTEKLLDEFLSDNDICCASCRLYNKNAKIHTIRDNACLCPRNKQLTVFDPQFFVPVNESFMCEQWLDTSDGGHK